MFEHSPERDDEVFHQVAMQLDARGVTTDLTRELLAIAKKWRSKATMRANRIEQLEAELLDLRGEHE